MEGFTELAVLSFFMATLSISSALDTLNVTQLMRDGDTLVSAGGRFELGFFSPGASRKRYLGIWYNNTSVQNTIAWVANREAPLNHSFGTLNLTNRGIFVLLDHDGTIVWSSNSSIPAHAPVAQLLDSGNLVVKEKNESNPENILWQSFDYPCDTLLEGMKFGRNFKTGLNRYLSSWKSPDDPSLGNFTYGYEIGGFPELIVREGSTVLFRPGPWNGRRFSGTPELNQNSIYTYGVVFNEEEVYFRFEVRNSSTYSRMVLNQNGIVQRLNWIDRTRGWEVYVTIQMDDCDKYAKCGANGICNIENSQKCSCLKGFIPKFPKRWDTSNWTSGCIRRIPLNCSTDKFLKYSGVKLPDSRQAWFNYSLGLEYCKELCTKNCSCKAYTNLDNGGASRCLLWFTDLVDIRQFNVDGDEIYIRVTASELENIKSEEKETLIIAVISALSAAFLILGVALALYLLKKRFQRKPGLLMVVPERSSRVKNPKEDLELPLFDLSTIVSATSGFSAENKLGEGGFGCVYKGILNDGQEIAVKKLSKNSRQGLEEFKNEAMHIAQLQHRNLVRLLGCCIQEDEKMLIYEFMPNRSLDSFIFDKTQSMSLDWPTRFNIINGIARGLLYLHHDSRQRLIHRDLKAGNILLDNEMNPKISDFGLARSFGDKESAVNTNKVVGTYGYMAPEYVIGGLYSIKSDVFSYGVLVLEILSGKRNRGFCHPDHQLNLLGHAWRLFGERKSLELIAPSIGETSNDFEVFRSIHVGLLCVQRNPEDRPNMVDVVLMLGSQSHLPQPKQPGFFNQRDLVQASSSSVHYKLFSSNDYTITQLNPR